MMVLRLPHRFYFYSMSLPPQPVLNPTNQILRRVHDALSRWVGLEKLNVQMMPVGMNDGVQIGGIEPAWLAFVKPS